MNSSIDEDKELNPSVSRRKFLQLAGFIATNYLLGKDKANAEQSTLESRVKTQQAMRVTSLAQIYDIASRNLLEDLPAEFPSGTIEDLTGVNIGNTNLRLAKISSRWHYSENNRFIDFDNAITSYYGFNPVKIRKVDLEDITRNQGTTRKYTLADALKDSGLFDFKDKDDIKIPETFKTSSQEAVIKSQNATINRYNFALAFDAQGDIYISILNSPAGITMPVNVTQQLSRAFGYRPIDIAHVNENGQSSLYVLNPQNIWQKYNLIDIVRALLNETTATPIMNNANSVLETYFRDNTLNLGSINRLVSYTLNGQDYLTAVREVRPLQLQLPELNGREDTTLRNAISAEFLEQYQITLTPIESNDVIVERNASGGFDYTPRLNVNGANIIRYNGLDRLGNTFTLEHRVNFQAVNDAPVVTIRQNTITASIDETVRLEALVSDVDSSNVRYEWQQTSGPRVTLTNSNTLSPSFIPEQRGTYAFILTADDGSTREERDVTVNVQGYEVVLNLRDYMDETPQEGATVRINDKTAITDRNGEARIVLPRAGNYDLLITQQERHAEAVNINVNNPNEPYNLEWTNASTDSLDLDLYETLFLGLNRRLVKWQDYSNINAQIATRPTIITEWEREIPSEEMQRNIDLVRFIYRAAVKIIGGVDVPNSAIRDVGGNPRYGPFGNLTIQWDDGISRYAFSGRGIGIEGNYITDGVADFRTTLRDRNHSIGGLVHDLDIFYKIHIKEIFGTLLDIDDPAPGTPANERLREKSLFVSGSSFPSLERQMERLEAINYNVPDAAAALLELFPQAEGRALIYIGQKPAVQEMRTVYGVGTLYSPSAQNN